MKTYNIEKAFIRFHWCLPEAFSICVEAMKELEKVFEFSAERGAQMKIAFHPFKGAKRFNLVQYGKAGKAIIIKGQEFWLTSRQTRALAIKPVDQHTHVYLNFSNPQP